MSTRLHVKATRIRTRVCRTPIPFIGFLFATLIVATLSPAMSQSTQTDSPGAGISSLPGTSGKERRLDYEHARPFPLPSIDCEPSKHDNSSKRRGGRAQG